MIILNGKDGDALPCGVTVVKSYHQSSAEAITIKFISDGSVTNKGFKLQYIED